MSATDGQRVHQIVIIGGGFGGVYTATALKKLCRHRPHMRVTLISRDNYFLMTPLLFEAGSGILEPRHAVNPIRPLFRGCPHVQFVEAEVTGVDFDARAVRGAQSNGEQYEIRYDQFVIALGSVTNTNMVKGTEHALTFKVMGDAIFVRNHVIDAFERADVERDPARRRALTTFVIIGGGLVGTELMGELTEFVGSAARYYPNVDRRDIRFVLIEAGPRLLMEMEDDLAGYAADVLRGRGVDVRAGARVKQIEPGRIHLPDAPDGTPGEVIEAATVIVSTGVRPAPLVDSFDLKKDARGRIEVGPDMRSVGRPDVWALGDNAAIPDAHNPGKWYPPLAQHALREARVLAKNLTAAKDGQPTKPFVYSSKGTLASLGQFKGVGKVIPFGKKGVKIYGLLGWWVWRTYYLFQMPRLSRRLRIMADWTISLMFKNDVAKLDTYGGEALRKQIAPSPAALMPGTAVTGPSPEVTPARPPPQPVGA